VFDDTYTEAEQCSKAFWVSKLYNQEKSSHRGIHLEKENINDKFT